MTANSIGFTDLPDSPFVLSLIAVIVVIAVINCACCLHDKKRLHFSNACCSCCKVGCSCCKKRSVDVAALYRKKQRSTEGQTQNQMEKVVITVNQQTQQKINENQKEDKKRDETATGSKDYQKEQTHTENEKEDQVPAKKFKTSQERRFANKIDIQKQNISKNKDDIRLSEKPLGFPNLGNTCYMNSILQNLVWTPLLCHQLSKNYDQKGHSGVTKALYELAKQVHTCHTNVSSRFLGEVLKAARLRNSQFVGNDQQDSFEMYNCLVGGIQDERLEAKPYKDKMKGTEMDHIMRECPLTRLMGGMYMTVYSYETCQHIELEFQMFTSICVPVPEVPHVSFVEEGSKKAKLEIEEQEYRVSGQPVHRLINVATQEAKEQKMIGNKHPTDDNGKNTIWSPLLSHQNLYNLTGIEHGLNELLKKEEFDEESLWCRKCENKSEKADCKKTLKKLFVIAAPPVLVLQINRFKQERRGLTKIYDTVSYPKVLNLSPYCSAAVKVIDDVNSTNVRYSLYGVVAHSGSLDGGHYFAYVKASDRYPEKLLDNFVEVNWEDPERFREEILNFLNSICDSTDHHIEITNNITTEETQCKKWHRISDSDVWPCDEKDVLNNGNAYVLFYERIG